MYVKKCKVEIVSAEDIRRVAKTPKEQLPGNSQAKGLISEMTSGEKLLYSGSPKDKADLVGETLR